MNRPDLYPLDKAATLKALLALADGPSSNAYLEQAIITRVNAVDASTAQFAVNLRDVLADKPGTNLAMQAGDIVQVFSRTDLSGVARHRHRGWRSRQTRRVPIPPGHAHHGPDHAGLRRRHRRLPAAGVPVSLPDERRAADGHPRPWCAPLRATPAPTWRCSRATAW